MGPLGAILGRLGQSWTEDGSKKDEDRDEMADDSGFCDPYGPKWPFSASNGRANPTRPSRPAECAEALVALFRFIYDHYWSLIFRSWIYVDRSWLPFSHGRPGGGRIQSLRAFRRAALRVDASGGPTMALRWPRGAHDGPKMAQDGTKMAPRWPQDGPRCPKMAPRWP